MGFLVAVSCMGARQLTAPRRACVVTDAYVCCAFAASIFGKQSTRALRQLACLAEHVRFEEGEAVFHQGDEPDGLYVIDEGFCSVEVEGLGTLATLSGEGTTFGELALFLDDVRSATVRAQSEARLLRMDKEALKIDQETKDIKKEKKMSRRSRTGSNGRTLYVI